MGPPGAGKGTQAEMLARKISYHRFSTGDAFRSVARRNTELGQKIKALIDNGYLAPPALAAEIVIAAIKEFVAGGQGLVFDGTPRTREEAAVVDAFFAEHGYGKPLVLWLTVDKEEMMRRNAKRKFCLGIAGDFPIVTEADQQRCRERGGHIGVRPDDEPEKFAARWQQFQDRTLPVIEQYKREGILHELDGFKSIEAVHDDIMTIITSRQQGV